MPTCPAIRAFLSGVTDQLAARFNQLSYESKCVANALPQTYVDHPQAIMMLGWQAVLACLAVSSVSGSEIPPMRADAPGR